MSAAPVTVTFRTSVHPETTRQLGNITRGLRRLIDTIGRSLAPAIDHAIDAFHDFGASDVEMAWYARQRAYRYSRSRGHWENVNGP